MAPPGVLSTFTGWKLLPQPAVFLQRDAGASQHSLAYLVTGVSSRHFKLCLGHGRFAKRVHVRAQPINPLYSGLDLIYH